MVTCWLCRVGIRMKKTRDVELTNPTVKGERMCLDEKACEERRRIRTEQEKASGGYYTDADLRDDLRDDLRMNY